MQVVKLLELQPREHGKRKTWPILKMNFLKKEYNIPLVADIHFNPKAAEVAAAIVEKVRINPGNYVDRNRGKVDFTESEYKIELEKIAEKLISTNKNLQATRNRHPNWDKSWFHLRKNFGKIWKYARRHGGISDGIHPHLPRF